MLTTASSKSQADAVKTVNILGLFALAACQRVEAEPRLPDARAAFTSYWDRGQAELTSYHLQQARYGELHEGHAVLVFVTEPFSKSKQVKVDNAAAAGADAAPVLKLNFTRKFNTGVYPYSMMTSVFKPISGERPIKVTTSSQEWCGHTFFQLNQKAGGYGGRLFSYFESEGDQTIDVPIERLEDDVWTQIRIDPSRLPTGAVTMLPGSTHLRLLHVPAKPQKANATLKQNKDGTNVYRITYTSLDRELAITFNRNFPYEIEGWTETYVSGWGPSAARLTTTAKRNKRLMSDYWNRHNNVDAKLRTALGI